MVTFEGVTKTFGGADGKPGFAALAGIDYTVPKGSITGIIGRSGAGKSTLIRLANGLEKPSSGRVIVDGVDVAA
ncbi:ATP-binding cassette domain-containing protein, partial [Achromobacter sp. SIMBA_011]